LTHKGGGKNEPALCVVQCQTCDRAAAVRLSILKYLAASLQVPQLNHLYTHIIWNFIHQIYGNQERKM